MNNNRPLGTPKRTILGSLVFCVSGLADPSRVYEICVWSHYLNLTVSGCEWEAARVKEATLQLIDHMCAGAPPQNRNSQVKSISSSLHFNFK